MKKSSAPADNVPQCALNSPDTPNSAATPHQREKSEKPTPKFPTNRNSGNSLHNVARQIKQEPQYSEWPSSYDNSNTSWDSEWPTTSSPQFPKQSLSGNSYKPRNPASYHSSSNDWSTGDSSNSSVPSSYAGMQATQQQQSASNCASASPSSYYENNNYYGGGYNYDSSYGGYAQPPYRNNYQNQQYQPPAKGMDSATGSYNGNRMPSGCPPAQPKQPVPEYNQRHPQYAIDPLYKAQIKREPPEFIQGEGDNFTSLFTKSLTSLYSEDPDNAYREDGNDPDIIVCTPPSAAPGSGEEHPSNYQRLMPTGNPYHPHPPPNYQNPRHHGYPYYDNRHHNAEPPSNVVDLEAGNDRTNSFRYDRPSFDDMHLYAPHSEPRPQPKKRKISMPHAPPDSNYPTESRRKVPRKRSIKSDSQWTPNSYVPFGNIQIKQEPEDDYMSLEKETPIASNPSSQDKSFSSNGACGRSPSQQSEHHKPAPRKRSPASTCFDRFEKKSTPLSKKVSPLSVYAKVQESVVLSVKCRRYKKRTKPANAKEEVVVYPGKDEIENWKKSGAYSQTPDQAVRILMRDLLEQVSQSDRRHVKNGPDLTELDPFKLQELLYQFCQRYSLDFRDFEDIHSVLQPRLIKDKSAKNSERASAIRKRTSASPAQAKSEVESESKNAKVMKASKRTGNENRKSAAKRLLRNLPGREPVPEEELVVTELRPTRRRSRKAPIAREQCSTKSEKDVDDKENNIDDKENDIDIIFESSTDRESEAGKEAEVRKKSERLKHKHPVTETLAKDKPLEKTINQTKEIKKVERPSKSKERSKERDKSKEESSTNTVRKWSRDQNNCGSVLRSASIEIVDITRSDSPSSTCTSKNGSEADFDISRTTVKRSTRRTRNSTKSTSRERPSKFGSETASVKSVQKQQEKKTDNKDNQSQKDKVAKSKKDPKENLERSNSSSNLEETAKTKKCVDKPNLPTRSPSKRNRIPKKLDYPGDDLPNIYFKTFKEDKNFENKDFNAKKDDSSSPKVDKNRHKNSSSRNKRQDIQKTSIEEDSTPQEEISVIKASDDSTFSHKDTKSRKSRLLGRSTRDRSSLNISKPDSEVEDDSKLMKIDTEEDTIEATEDGKLSALLENEKSSTEVNNKGLKKKPCPNSVKKENELVESVPKTSSRRQSEYPIKKRDKSVQIAVNKPIVVKRETSNEGVNAKAANNSTQLLQKKFRHRNILSQDSEPQVVLMKLPDVHINATMGSIPLEYFERYVSKEKNRSFVSEEHKGKNSDDNSSVGSPPVLVSMKEIDKERDEEKKMSEMESSSKTSFDSKDDSTPLPLIHYDAPMNSEPESSAPKKPKLVKELRYSADSEDSDCALVIDLDRRMSVEEETPAPVSNNSSSEKETKESVISKDTSGDQTPAVPSLEYVSEPSCSHSDSSNKPQSDKPAEPQADLNSDNISLDDLESVEKLVEETLPTLLLKAEQIKKELPFFSNDQPLKKIIKKVVESNESTARGSKEQTRVESILRSALTERRKDGSTGSSQSCDNEDSKLQFLEDFAKLFMDGEDEEAFSTDSIALDAQTLSEEVQKTYEDMKLALDLLPDFNVKVSDKEDWIYDSNYIKDKLEKLKHEITRLRSLAYQKEKERINMICFQRYLKGCIKSFMTEHCCDGIKQEVDENEDLSSLIPDIQTLYMVARRLIRITTLALTIAKSGAMALLKLCPLGKQFLAAEKLPLVAKLVADATENYGVDLRMVKTGSPAPTPKPTILETVLTSKEPTFNQSTLEKVPKEESSEKIPHLIQKTDSSPKKLIPSSRDSPFRPYSSNSSPDTDKSEGSSLQFRPHSSNPSPEYGKSESSSHQFRPHSSNSSPESNKPENSSTHQFRPHSSNSPPEASKSENSSSPFGPHCSTSSPESNKAGNPSHPTILQQALSKETSHSQSSSHNLSASSSIKIHPSAPALPSTSYQEDAPLDFSKEGKPTSSVSLPSSYIPTQYKEDKLKNSAKSYPKSRSSVSYSIWKKSQAIKHKQPPPSALNLKVDCPKAEETAVITQGPAAKTKSFSTHSPTSQTIMMKSSSAHHQVLSPKLIPYQQRPDSVDHLHGNHRSLPSEGDRLHPQRSDNSNPGEPHLKGNSNQFYNRKIKEAHQSLSYSSAGATSDPVRLGVAHQRSPTQNFTITKQPSEMHSPNHSPYSCNGCGALGAKFLCSGCRDHWYCSAQCQNVRWPEHRLVCPGFMYSNSARPSPVQNSSTIDQ